MSDDSWWLDLTELDAEQQKVIDLPDDGNYIVVGPPGSGKTNLLLLRASYLVNNQRPNVVVLMFTRSLRDFVVRGADKYNVAPEKIMTIMRWGTALLREQNVPTDDLPDGFEEQRAEIALRIKLVLDSRPALEGYLECILVDEVQDCLQQEIENFFRCGRNVFFVGDERQRIYRGEGIISNLVVRPGMVLRSLTHHYRSGPEICKVADAIGKTSGEPAILPTSNYNNIKNKSKAEFFPCTDASDQNQRIITQLTQELKAYPGELLGVACPLREDVDQVRSALAASPLGVNLIDTGKLAQSDSEQCIYVATLHDVKGLEFRALHLSSMHNISKLREYQKKISYTGVTRAKTLLSIYWVGRIPGYLEQAREAVASGRKFPTAVKDLFPRKKS